MSGAGSCAVLCIFALAFVGGCSHRFYKEELVGAYTLNTGPAIETLELRRNGDYTYGDQESGAAKKVFTGKWQLDDTKDGQVVTLDNFGVLRSGGSASRNGFYVLSPTRFFGSVRLVQNADLNRFYKKE
jgi:hypothetical protein